MFDIQRFGERVAFVSGDKTLTYRDLYTRACRLADRLRQQGNSPVILCGKKEPQMLVAMTACLMTRRTYIPLEPDIPHKRLESIVARTGSTLVLTPDTLERLEQYQNAPLSACDSPTAYVIFTSGSTGVPKGVPISRNNLRHFAGWITRQIPADRPLCVLNQASFSFDLSVADLCFALGGGHTLVAYTGEDSLKQTDFWVVTPTFVQGCLCDPTFDAANYPRLQTVYCCGERLEKATADKLLSRFPHLKLYNAYGPTEATSAVSLVQITPDTPTVDGLLPVGKLSTAATTITVENGEIVLYGDSVFGGYLGAPDKALPEKGYRTGDEGFVQNDLLYCRGRRDRRIKYKGYRIELDEVETALCALDGVQNAAVVTRKSGDTVIALCAFVVSDRDPHILREELKASLPAYMLPKTVTVVERLPVSANGKLDRKELATW